jgi:hypothetical protein
MELTEEQYQEIEGLPPKRRGHVKIDNRTFLGTLSRFTDRRLFYTPGNVKLCESHRQSRGITYFI